MMKIGVWNTAFLGDAILTLPLLQTIRAAYPDAVIDFWVRGGIRDLFTAHPAASNVYEYDKRGNGKGVLQSMRFGRELARKDYSLWISAHGSFRSGVLARLTGAKIRIGYAEPKNNALFYTHAVPRRFTELDEIERLLRLALPLDLPGRGLPVFDWPKIALPQSARDAAEHFFTSLHAEAGGKEYVPVLGVHPGSIWGTKRWPVEYFAAIAKLAAREGARVLVFGGQDAEEAMARQTEELAGQSLTDAEKRNIVNLAGKLSLPELGAYIGRLSCYVTNDSGPMHLAWPQKTPVTALFGPTARELGFYPRGENATVMELPLPCRPCGLHGPQECPLGHHRCMREMTPDMVWPVVARKLFGKIA